MVNILVSGEAYDKVFNYLDMLHAPLEEKVLIITNAKSLLLLLVLPPDVLATHSAWIKASKEIASLMLMTMDPDIQKNLEQLGAYDTLKELKTLYEQQAGTSSDYNLERLGHAMTQNLEVSLILVSLRKEYDSFVQNYNMYDMGKTMTELHTIIKLHEQTLPKKDAAPALHTIRVEKV
ncbi:hypothetical protein Tco_0827601 [Tanacetum coccineum]